ncbi:MAG TPA: hypothetical protein DCM08_04715 [Microscillaceae bacterium]|nr:hypothetical protein [Microscillaceae bacterium]
MNCRICEHPTTFISEGKMLNKYDISYFHCPNCDALQTEKPFWLQEAYKDTINLCDVGLVKRNLRAAKIVSSILYFFFDSKANYLDYAGGYGLLTRLMRDNGFNFFWADPYTPNLMSRGFEGDVAEKKYKAITILETFEHFTYPLEDIRKMLELTDNIIATTDMYPKPIPNLDKWDYYGLKHGQHVIFYSHKTFRYIANTLNLHYYNIDNYHILTKKPLNIFISLIPKSKLDKILLFALSIVPYLLMKSKLYDDFDQLKDQ